ncbi:Alpha-tubulin suppressor [Paenibacillus algorifonticola]|uniref:Alpha-tubulin suppressor n=1 Tax=Paenibacillus algorifonticola TaxID=684063 RepID=A0A1I2DLX6_9BACL|nr:S-layer homology domain-containing protein [Paenibacillus algorifonticola]SFE81662.1 Alpha-tubulin suppressor [Paenibacillus algorifonticola]
MLFIQSRKMVYPFLILVLLMGLLTPYGQSTAYAAQEGMRSVKGVQIAAGANHSVMLKADGTVVAWGLNSVGQANVPRGLANVISVAAGSEHSLALKADGTVVGWGNNSVGETTVPNELAAGGVTAIAAGGGSSLALKSDGTVVAWGDNQYGHLNVPPAAETEVVSIAAGKEFSLVLKSDGTVVAWGQSGATNVPAGLSNVVSIAAGSIFAMALKADGTIVAWGNNASGQTIIPTGAADGEVVSISASRSTAMALKADGTVVAWGGNDTGQTDVPAGLNDVVAIASGWFHSLALKADGTVVAWGSNNNRQKDVPAGHASPIKGSRIAAGGSHTLALKSNGTLSAWGDNGNGQSAIPVGLGSVESIAGGANHSLALKSDGTVAAWGSNSNGQSAVPAGLDNVASIAAGANHSLALKSDGTVTAWGSNTYGESTVPIGLDEVIAIAGGEFHSLALQSDHTVVAWGRNNYGQSTVPAGLDQVVSIAAGDSHSLALKLDGTVVAWGNNNSGQRTVPAGLENVVSIAAGAEHSLALKADGTVVAWGSNASGQINVPAGLDNVVSIAAGAEHSLALKADGSVIAWGNDDFGQSTVPGKLIDLKLQEGDFTEAFDVTVTSYTYYYDGQSLSSAHITPTMTDPDQILVYVNNQSITSGSAATINLAGATTDTVIPVRVEPYFFPNQKYTITLEIDSTPPEVEFSTNGGLMPATSASSKVTVSDTQSGVEPSSLLLYAWTQGTAVPTGGWTAFSNEDTLSQTNVDGDWYLHIRALDKVGNVVDAVSNPFVLDNTAPTVTVSSSASQTVNAAFPVTITFNESVIGFTVDDLAVVNGTASNLVSVGASTYTATITPLTSGQAVTVSIGAGAAANAAGLDNTASNTLSLLYNTAKPVVAFSGFTDQQSFVVPPAQVSVTVSESVYWINGGAPLTSANAQPLISMSKDGQAFSSYTTSFDESLLTYTLTFNGTLNNGLYRVNAAGGEVENEYGNALDAATASFSVVSAATSPSVTRSSNANLAYLNVFAGGKAVELSPLFTPGTTEYITKTNAKEVELQLAPAHAMAAVKLLGEHIGKTTNVPLVRGENVFAITVQAEDGTIKTYTLKINRISDNGNTGSACTFEDIKNHWAASKICEAAGLGIVDGMSTGTFGPNGYVTRTEFAVMLLRTLQIPISNESIAMSFSDKDSIPAWAQQAIQTAVAEGILEGYSDGTLRPQQTVNRAEMAAMVSRAMKWEIDSQEGASFTDAANIPAWAKAHVHNARVNGLIEGREGNRFVPAGLTTRAEATVVLLRLWNILY